MADTGNHTIRKIVAATVAPQAAMRRVVLATGAVTLVLGRTLSNAVLPGPAPASLSAPWGLAWVPNLGLLISDLNENALLLAR